MLNSPSHEIYRVLEKAAAKVYIFFEPHKYLTWFYVFERLFTVYMLCFVKELIKKDNYSHLYLVNHAFLHTFAHER